MAEFPTVADVSPPAAPAPPPVTAAPGIELVYTAVEQTVPTTEVFVAAFPLAPVPAEPPPAPLKLGAQAFIPAPFPPFPPI